MLKPKITASRRVRRTPYSDRTEALGARDHTVYNHMLMPSGYRPGDEDYWHLKRHVQVWDVACERQVELQGPDATKLAQLMTPRDLSRAKRGQGLYAPLCDGRGGMVNDPIALKLAEDRWWLSIADSDVLLWAKGLAEGRGLDVNCFEPDVSPLAIQGPKADVVAGRLFGEKVTELRFFWGDWFPFQGHPLYVARSGWSKQGGFEIYLDRWELGGALWDAAMAAGQDQEIGPGSPNTMERIEGGLLSYGSDMTLATTPLECGLERYCNLDRDLDTLSHSALRKQQAEGVTRKLRGLRLDSKDVPLCAYAWPVLDGSDSQVGEVTSAARSPAFDQGLALAYLSPEAWATATALTVETPEGRMTATVSDVPFTE